MADTEGPLHAVIWFAEARNLVAFGRSTGAGTRTGAGSSAATAN
jgi:hypothetical protein